jgi:GTP-binding protein
MEKIFTPLDVRFERGFANPEELGLYLEALPQESKGLNFVGRSNVGKSSLVNRLFGKNTARVSNTPGRTQEINLFSFSINEKRYFFFDLPGYGFAQVSKQTGKLWQQLMDAFFEFLPENFLTIIIQDARHPMQEADKAFINFFNHYPHPSFLAFNKIDKLKTQKERSQLDKLKPQITKETPNISHIFYISAETKQGFDHLEKGIKNYFEA